MRHVAFILFLLAGGAGALGYVHALACRVKDRKPAYDVQSADGQFIDACRLFAAIGFLGVLALVGNHPAAYSILGLAMAVLIGGKHFALMWSAIVRGGKNVPETLRVLGESESRAQMQQRAREENGADDEKRDNGDDDPSAPAPPAAPSPAPAPARSPRAAIHKQNFEQTLKLVLNELTKNMSERSTKNRLVSEFVEVGTGRTRMIYDAAIVSDDSIKALIEIKSIQTSSSLSSTIVASLQKYTHDPLVCVVFVLHRHASEAMRDKVRGIKQTLGIKALIYEMKDGQINPVDVSDLDLILNQ